MLKWHLLGLTQAALEEWARAHGASAGGARALARNLLAQAAGRLRRGGESPSQALLASARSELSAALPRAEAFPDPDGTVRFAVHLEGGAGAFAGPAVVEAVAIHQPAGDAHLAFARARARWTVCVSSQAGCARGCTFCETGRLGLLRNLAAAEIVSQVALVTRHLEERGEERPRNVVFMGMGEPLDNLEEVLRAIAVLSERGGFAIPERRITVSTVGIVPRMGELYARSGANLAVSLHALEEPVRRALLPVARKWSLPALREALSRAPRTVLLQWTLIEGTNDRDQDADALAAFCAGLDVRVNLIPLNPGPDPAQRAPSLDRCRAFQRRLANQGVRALLRLPHGQAVGAACGQLAGAARG